MITAQTTPVVAVVLAAGSGLRFDPANPKQLVSLAGTPIVGWSIAAFERNPRVTDILVVVNAQVRQAVEQLIAAAGYTKVQAVIDGGAERSDSTEAALRMLADHGVPADAKVLIHDSVRPFVSQAQIDGCIDALDEFKAATVACPSTDTILLTQDLGDRETVVQVPERRHSFRAQTPQAFRFETIRTAYDLAADDPDFRPTDDTRVVVDYLPNEPVAIVGGSPLNMKVTTQDDMPFAQLIAGRLAE
ncbi:IspD/TarI family cytidylyltransferase [Bifidobacterium pseudolongum]|jgi:2-C-methyl-D-erythritol 4-phosphate cytidylyltransferase|uniref:2-C-methyl-D-erythritol 4-phosphate cytidylyltransferase n=1 Tax=Bifidobacterium pseudolongum subsp. globosum TaxID=1690 RepID=A0A4V1Y3G7_9BIFI|nr:IspD/TarI family cytidylyltransferase [Bifidobacterium pseudolongum]MCI8754434.1 2-C-methyl-D-erythritol 4-phosphate cytidylyltransferase [Bifidobacterium pseudolongum]RYQ27369.1 2-C-methyl-D-erythritol 4-phosphate cytidylyltransferase [Bifidobacterium pseudolongum subsp. globosum]RYQ27808.1 2-C-methyl-D-erythritol 4-phosphate cytidylyltransferase [Bifidobacterium pseudolongum subsp. globosum]